MVDWEREYFALCNMLFILLFLVFLFMRVYCNDYMFIKCLREDYKLFLLSIIGPLGIIEFM